MRPHGRPRSPAVAPLLAPQGPRRRRRHLWPARGTLELLLAQQGCPRRGEGLPRCTAADPPPDGSIKLLIFFASIHQENSMEIPMTQDDVKASVREKYGQAAKRVADGDTAASCCG